MPKSSIYTLIWSAEQQCYELQRQGHTEQRLEPGDEQAWLGWLAAHHSFSFQGQQGRLRVVKETRPRGEGYWYAYAYRSQHTRKRYLGRTSQLLLPRLEETAHVLRSELERVTPEHRQQTSPAAPAPARSTSAAVQSKPISQERELSAAAPQRESKARTSQPNVLLKRARLAHGWSQKEVANLVGAPLPLMVTRWENGVVFPGPDYREKLCALFQMAPKELGLLRRPAAESETVESAEQPGPIIDPAIPLGLDILPRLIGRDALLAELTCRLQEHAGGRIALMGLPGVGKTALASASELQECFPDGVLWAGLGPKPQLFPLLSRWSSLLGLTNEETSSLTSSEQWMQLLREVIGERRLLMVIDDAWSLEDALACQVGGPHCVYLLTTRLPEVALQFAGQQVVQVPELALEDGVQMLTQYAPALKQSGEEVLRSLVQAVGGLPLALKLMGIYLAVQTHHQQARRSRAALLRLHQATERLQLAQPQAGPQRDPRLPLGTPFTLQAMIELSERMLTLPEQQALSALSVFPSKPQSFSEEAALFVMAAPAETLDRLVDTGLLEVSTQDRYQLHQTIADYARTRRSDSGAETRLIDYVRQYIEQYQHENAQLDQESQIIFTALEAARKRGERKVYLSSLLRLIPYLLARQPYHVIEQQLRRAEQEARAEGDQFYLARIIRYRGEVLRDHGNFAQAEAILREGLSLLPDRDIPESIDMLSTLGVVFVEQGNYLEAGACMDDVIARAERISYQEQLGSFYGNRAALASIMGDLAVGEQMFLKVYALEKHSPMSRAFIMTALNLGILYTDKGDFPCAHQYLQEANQYARNSGNDDRLAAILESLGNLAYFEGAYTHAKSLFAEALTFEGLWRHKRFLIEVFARSSLVAVKMGDFAQAHLTQQEASALLPPEGLSEQRCLLLAAQALTALERGDTPQAHTLANLGLKLARQIQHRPLYCELLLQLGGACQREGASQEAQGYLQEGFALAEALAMPRLIGEARLAWGEHFLLQQEYGQAREHFEALMSTVPHDHRELIARAHAGLAAAAAAGKQDQEAHQHGQAALALFEQMQHFRQHELRDFLRQLP